VVTVVPSFEQLPELLRLPACRERSVGLKRRTRESERLRADVRRAPSTNPPTRRCARKGCQEARLLGFQSAHMLRRFADAADKNDEIRRQLVLSVSQW
jgi:hypothetical protein